MSSTNEKRIRIVDSQHPYLGLDSFKEEDKEFFYGRNNEVEKLFNLIEDHSVTIFFGSSGLGKTSLLQAGLFPKLKQNFFFPIYIRLDFKDRSKSPVEQTKLELRNQISKIDKDIISENGLCLWEYLHKLEIKDNLVKPVLVFDQFEEIFTVGRGNLSQIEEFKSELIDIVEDQVPVSVQQKYESKEIPFNFQERDYRIIISLREDYLPKLEKWNELMPSIKNSRFPVVAMDRKQAFEAISLPGKEIIKSNEVNLILEKIISSTYSKEEGGISQYEFEPFLLSLICERINNKRFRMERDKEIIVHDKISADVIKTIEIEDIIRGHYLDNTSPNERIIIEEKLLTIDGFRNLHVLSDLYIKDGITPVQIKNLISHRIIRQTTRNKIDYIELIHDVLVPVVKENRDIRKKIEQEKEKKKQIQKFIYLNVIPVLVVVAIIASLLIINAGKREKTQKATKLVGYSLPYREKTILDPTLSLRLAEAAYDVEPKNEETISNLIAAYYSGPFNNILDSSKKSIQSIELSNDHQYLFIQYFDQTIRLYRLTNDALVKIPFDTTMAVVKAKFSEEGNSLLTICLDSIVRVWNINNENLVKEKEEIKLSSFPISAEFSPHGGDYILFSGIDSKSNIWKSIIWGWRQQGNPISLEHDNDLDWARFTTDGNWIFTKLKNGNVFIWDLNGKKISSFSDDMGNIEKIEFSNLGNKLITIDSMGITYLWNFSNGQLQDALRLNKLNESINIAKFTLDGKGIIIIPSSKIYMELWAIEKIEKRNAKNSNQLSFFKPTNNDTNYTPIIFKKITDPINSIDFSDDSLHVIATSDKNFDAIIWDLNGNKQYVLRGHEAPIISTDFLDSGLKVLTFSFDNIIRLWQLEIGSLIEDRRILSYDTVNFNSDVNDTINILNSKGVRTQIRRSNVNYVFVSKDQKYILTQSSLKCILWNIKGDSIKSIGTSINRIMSVDFKKKGNTILFCFSGNRIEKYDAKRKKTFEFSIKSELEVKEAWFSSNEDYIFIKYSNEKIVEIPISPSLISRYLKEKNNIREMNDEEIRKFGIE